VARLGCSLWLIFTTGSSAKAALPDNINILTTSEKIMFLMLPPRLFLII
jgi:hypothetical protein